jgi:hypothetical protein
MSLLASGIRAVRQRISEKLGVCPFCMRASALGTISAWTIYWLAAWIAPWLVAPAPIRFLILIVAWSFTLLIASHLTAYMIRTARFLRSREVRTASAAMQLTDRTLTRRDFMKTVLAAGAYAATIAVLGHIPSFGQATCTGKHDVDFDINAFGGDEKAAREIYDEMVDARCDDHCSTFPCGTAGGCVRSTVAPRVRAQPKCVPDGAGFTCTGKVKQCNCTCNKCFGDHNLNKAHGRDYAHGIGSDPIESVDKMLEDARKKCDDECARYTDCSAPTTCKRNGDPPMDGQWKQGGVHTHQRIKHCKCHCA